MVIKDVSWIDLRYGVWNVEYGERKGWMERGRDGWDG